MKELKLTDPIKVGYYAYHISYGIVDDWMKIGRDNGTVVDIIKEGWSFVSRTKKYKKGQKASIPKSQLCNSKNERHFLDEKKITPPKITGTIIRNADPKGCGITCLTLRKAYDELRNAMTVQDERDFMQGILCISLQIIKTPEQFKPTHREST